MTASTALSLWALHTKYEYYWACTNTGVGPYLIIW